MQKYVRRVLTEDDIAKPKRDEKAEDAAAMARIQQRLREDGFFFDRALTQRFGDAEPLVESPTPIAHGGDPEIGDARVVSTDQELAAATVAPPAESNCEPIRTKTMAEDANDKIETPKSGETSREVSSAPHPPPLAKGEATKPRGKPFKKGQSGNRGGRPRGSPNRAKSLAEALPAGKAEELLQKALDDALGDNPNCCRNSSPLCTPRRKRGRSSQ